MISSDFGVSTEIKYTGLFELNIDIEGFLGQPMQLRISGQYRDSILAAPMCLDLCRFMELAHRRDATGAQEWLSLYFKAPYATRVHEFHKQEQMLLAYLNEAQ